MRGRIVLGRYHARPVRIEAAHPLVLGSASPRRREMISWLGVPFVVRTADVDESTHAGEEPHAYLARVTLAKLDAVRALDLGPAAGVLVADTMVVAPDGPLPRAVLGKPADEAEAREMIERLAGATHEVSTRFALAEAAREAPVAHVETVTARVRFRAVSREEAEAYARTGEGKDKAGGYAVQGRAAAFVSAVEGSYTTVIGLPLSEVVVAMRALGWL
jgi:septum formation protein